MVKRNNLYLIIMAGGTGTRLFPLSRKKTPKQFLKLISGKSLLQETFNRVKSIFPISNIYISTNENYKSDVAKQLPQVKKENIICEPAKRNTAPAMGLVASLIYHQNPQAICATIASDHTVLKPKQFHKVMRAGAWQVQQDKEQIITIGIKPESPHTGYGYIERGEKINTYRSTKIFQVKRFVEKPTLPVAKKYLASGKFFWNASYFIWSAKHFLDEINKFEPKLARGLKKISTHFGKKNWSAICAKQFPLFDNLPIDTAIMEKTKKLAVIPAELGWSDIGAWDQVAKERARRKISLADGDCLEIKTRNCLIKSKDKLIIAVGVKDLAIIESENAILVTSFSQSQLVKEAVEKLEQKNRKEFL